MTEFNSDAWEVIEVTPLYRRSRLSLGDGKFVLRTEHFADEEIQALNDEERKSRDGKRWSSGTGSEKGGNVPMIRVARTPVNKFMADVAPYLTQGDEDHIRWWLNDERSAPFRTRSGKV